MKRNKECPGPKSDGVSLSACSFSSVEGGGGRFSNGPSPPSCRTATQLLYFHGLDAAAKLTKARGVLAVVEAMTRLPG